jgi:hypothetical protein
LPTVHQVDWAIEPEAPGLSKLTVTHDVEGAPRSAVLYAGEISGASGGWSFILSDLKTLLETGQPLAG